MLKWKGILFLSLMSTQVVASSSLIVRFSLTDSMKSFLRSHEFDITGINYKEKEIEALLSEEEFEQLKSQKTDIKFSFPQNLALAPDPEYMNPEKIESFLKDIAARYPQITALKEVGKSFEGRTIWAIKISDNPELDEREPAILFNSMHHAREIMTPEITKDMVEYLTAHFGKDLEVTKWVNNYEIWVIPMLNVDGNNKMWTKDSMWRKNTRDEHGVDLNRNYPTGWNSCKGSSSSTWAQDYRGRTPASEPETQSMMAFVSAIKPVFNISYHSYSELVLYPYGCTPKKTPLTEAVETIGGEIAKKLGYTPGTPWELLYNADGGDIDWMYVEEQVIPYVIEVNSNREGFHPDYKKWRDKTVLKNRAGWMHLLQRLEGASLQGLSNPGEYKTVKIFRPGEGQAIQTYKINPDGSYYIILKPGTYDFVFQGDQDQKFSAVKINEARVLNL